MAGPTCKHGVSLERSCLKCGRFIPMVDETYREKQANFDRSIQDLEKALKPFLEEVEKAKAEIAELERQEQPPELDRPWYKKH